MNQLLPLLFMQNKKPQNKNSGSFPLDTEMLEEIAEYTPPPARRNIKAICAMGKCLKEDCDENTPFDQSSYLKMVDIIEKYSQAQTPLMLIRLMLSTGNLKNTDNSMEGMMSILSTVLPYSMRKNLPDLPTLMNMIKIMQTMSDEDDEDEEDEQGKKEEHHKKEEQQKRESKNEKQAPNHHCGRHPSDNRKEEKNEDSRLKDIHKFVNSNQFNTLQNLLNNKKGRH